MDFEDAMRLTQIEQIRDLPTEIKERIAAAIGRYRLQDLMNLSLASKSWYFAIGCERIWKRRASQDFGCTERGADMSWRETYKQEMLARCVACLMDAEGIPEVSFDL